jgi:serine/threonine protein kinase
MSISINEFWKLAVASGLLTPARCKELHAAFGGLKGAALQANTLSLTEWLVSGGTLSRYQAALLAAGRPGPFVFGDFVICDRVETGRLAHFFRAAYQGKPEVMLVFTAQLPGLAERPESVAEQTHAAIAIHSPHVMRVHQFVAGPPHSFTVIEGLQGQSLREYLAQQKPALDRACRIGFQSALGLVAMHAQKSLHGKLCPEQIWIDPAGTVKLLQFPLAPRALPQERLELPLADYLAPELSSSQQAASDLADIYGLGCTLYELIAGRVPFPGGTVQQKLARHRGEIPQRLDHLVPGVPEELADLVAEMIDKEPLLRCRTASQVAHLLAPFASDDGGSQRRRTGPPKLDRNALTPGYGAWRAPSWQSPPQQAADPRSTSAAEDKTEPAPKGPATRDSLTGVADAATRPRAASGEPAATDSRLDAAGFEPAQASGSSRGEGSSSADAPWEAPLAASRPGGIRIAKPAQRRVPNTALVGVGICVALLAAIIVAGLWVSSSEDSPAETAPSAAVDDAAPGGHPDRGAAAPAAAAPISDPRPSTPDAKAPPRPAIRETDDDGHTLWVSPTAGEPLVLNYLPSSAQVFIVLRPAELLESAEGAKLFDVLGPAGESAKSQLRSTLGVELAEVEQLSIAFFPDDAGAPQAAYAMRLRKAIPQATLCAAWGRPAAAEHKSKKFFQGPRFAYYLAENSDGRVAAIASAAAIQEIIERDGPPLLRKDIERLLRNSDAARHFNLLFAPSYLFTDGQSLLVGDLEKLREPLLAFLDESVQAVLLSGHLGEQLFLEFRALGSKPSPDLLQITQARLEKVPEQVENYVASLEPRPYGRLVVNRFPRMVQLLNDYTRGAVDDQQAVWRCYLPAIAAHNLLLGAELTLFEQPTAASVADARQPVKERIGAAAALEKKISLSFPRDTLERCLALLAEEIGVEVVILGPDLQLEGITKNQSFGLDERERPAGEILHKVLKLANPSGKLVYVIKPPDRGREAIFITTRSAATKRGDPLPKEFEPKTAKEQP